MMLSVVVNMAGNSGSRTMVIFIPRGSGSENRAGFLGERVPRVPHGIPTCLPQLPRFQSLFLSIRFFIQS